MGVGCLCWNVTKMIDWLYLQVFGRIVIVVLRWCRA
jgi:hypothetical protein